MLFFVLIALAVALPGGPAKAVSYVYQVDMHGTDQAPPVSTNAWGFVRFFFSDDRASVAAVFTLHDAAGNVVPGTRSWPRPDTLVFRPRTWLAPGAAYRAVAGAGIPGGAVYGRTDDSAEEVTENPVSPADLTATILAALGVDPDHHLVRQDRRPVAGIRDPGWPESAIRASRPSASRRY